MVDQPLHLRESCGPLITMVFQHFPPFPGAGALKSWSIADALASADGHGAKVHVLTSLVEDTSRPETFTAEGLIEHHIDNDWSLVRRIVGEIRLGWRAAFRIMRGHRPDCLVISSPAYLTALMVSFAARLLRLPYVLEIRDIYPEVYAAAGVLRAGSLPYRIVHRLSRAMYRGAAAVVTATEGLARHVAALSGRSDIYCVYNGYPAALRAIRGTKHPRFTVGFHGVMGFYQDVETLIEVARTLEPHGVDVVVVGYGRKDALLRGETSPNLRFLGRLSFEQTVAEMSRVQVGLCLRTDDEISQDAFPVKLFEYIGLELPSVVTPPCEGGTFAQDSGCGVVLAAGDVEAIVSEILRLRDDQGYYRARADACAAVGPQLTREALSRDVARIIFDNIARAGRPG